MRVVGIDPGSKSFDLFGYQFEQLGKKIHFTEEWKTHLGRRDIFLAQSIPTSEIMENPSLILDILEQVRPLDKIVAPSGFGMGIKQIQKLTKKDLFQLTLRKPSNKPTMGLEKVLREFIKSDLPAIVVPGVKNLPTVAMAKKVNKIDLGTADKVCSAVAGIEGIVREKKQDLKKIDFILLELGGAFSAALAIKGGQIVDGIGGTNLMGMQAGGAIDGELAYLFKNIKKSTIYSGGVEDIRKKYPVVFPNQHPINNSINDSKIPKPITENPSTEVSETVAMETFYDRVVKAVLGLLVNYSPGTIWSGEEGEIPVLLAGRKADDKSIVRTMRDRLQFVGPVKKITRVETSTKRAAQGAAMIAEGLSQGATSAIINRLEIPQAQGNALDHLYFSDL